MSLCVCLYIYMCMCVWVCMGVYVCMGVCVCVYGCVYYTRLQKYTIEMGKDNVAVRVSYDSYHIASY